MRDLAAILIAGMVYFAVVFALGFGLGALRVLIVAPRLGEGAATALELPAMLTASWFVCRWSLEVFGIRDALSPRLAIGLLALALLLSAEAFLGIILLGRSIWQQIVSYRQPGPAMGLMAQLIFASMPLLDLVRTWPRSSPRTTD